MALVQELDASTASFSRKDMQRLPDQAAAHGAIADSASMLDQAATHVGTAQWASLPNQDPTALILSHLQSLVSTCHAQRQELTQQLGSRTAESEAAASILQAALQGPASTHSRDQNCVLCDSSEDAYIPASGVNVDSGSQPAQTIDQSAHSGRQQQQQQQSDHSSLQQAAIAAAEHMQHMRSGLREKSSKIEEMDKQLQRVESHDAESKSRIAGLSQQLEHMQRSCQQVDGRLHSCSCHGCAVAVEHVTCECYWRRAVRSVNGSRI